MDRWLTEDPETMTRGPATDGIPQSPEKHSSKEENLRATSAGLPSPVSYQLVWMYGQSPGQLILSKTVVDDSCTLKDFSADEKNNQLY